MDFDTAKENIQPLRHGRRADRLELALGNEKELLDQERREHEELIESTKGSIDPLGAWYEYICWIEQSYLKSGVESGLDEAVSKCLYLFENDTRYKQDRRLIKLFIKYIDTQENPQELYNQLYVSGIGTMVADLYIAWSHYYDAADDFKQTEAIFRKGLDAGAQPYEELAQAHQNFSISMSQRIIYNDEESKKKFRATMEEKRGALTLLRAHKKKTVGSIRTGFAVVNENPGRFEMREDFGAKGQNPITVHEDGGQEQQPGPSSSIMRRNIVDLSKKKNENFLEAGPWSKVKMKTAVSTGPSKPVFKIMEDNLPPPIECKNKLFELGVQLPPDFAATNQPHKPCGEYPMIVDEPVNPRVIPAYDKFSAYPNDHTEISPEEIRGFHWFVSRGNLTAPVVEKYADLLLNKFENGPRLYPKFCNESIVEPEVKFMTVWENHARLSVQLPLTKMYHQGYETKSMEELLADKYYRGEIKLVKCEDFEENENEEDDLLTAEMEMTIAHTGRHSIYPLTRKSFVPRKSILRKSLAPPRALPNLDEDVNENPRAARLEAQPEEDENPQEAEEEVVVKIEKLRIKSEPLEFKQEVPSPVQSDDQRASLKRKLTTPDKTVESKSRFVSETPPPRANVPVEPPGEVFKPPLPPVQEARKSMRPFDLPDDDDTFCSTQKFNLFVKASSISTPNNTKKTVPRLLPLQPIPLHESPEKLSPPKESKLPLSENEESPENAQQNPPALTKLSTIMETTETTHSTKSSCYENESHAKTPMSTRKQDQIVESEKSGLNAFEIFRIPEEQTETLPFQKSMKFPKAFEINDVSIQRQMPTMKFDVLNEISQVQLPKLDDSDEIPATQDFPMLEKDENVMIPVTQEKKDESHLEIPATQEISQMIVPPIDESQIEIPATQEVANISNFEVPATQEVYQDEIIPATQEVETTKKEANGFAIFEDSICVPPQPAQQEASKANESKLLHISCKENLPPIVPRMIHKSTSEELLELCARSPNNFKNESAKTEKNDFSDLLKFSACASIEGSFKALEINPPAQVKSASPTMLISDEDLNTEKFKFPLVGEKNSTLLIDAFKKKTDEMLGNLEVDPVNISLDMNEEEMNLLQSKDVIFKVPQIPITKVAAPPAKPVYVHNTTPFTIFEDTDQKEPTTSKKSIAEEIDDEDDMSKSIYYHNFEKEELKEEPEASNEKTWEDQAMCSFIENDVNRYEYTIIQEDSHHSLRIRNAIEESNGNPFSRTLHNLVLEQCNFEQYLEEHVPDCKLLKNIPKLKSGTLLEVNSKEFRVGKFIAKGSFGSVYIVENTETKNFYAAKQEKPSNLWEYFICMELSDRLKSNNLEHMLPAFMQINHAIVGNNASVFITELSPFGTIIDVCNKVKKATSRNLDEYVGMVLTTQLLSIIDFLHSCHIIHGDIKPDNFLLMSKVELGSKVPALQLIDFGSAIDMDVYSKKDEFTYVVKTENFTCCEMQEKKSWTYQTDLFGLAGIAHVMLFGKYMQVEKKIGKWDITSRYPRYFRQEIWKTFFDTLLNIPDSFSMPNLQELKQMLLDDIASRGNYVADKVSEFNSALLQ